MIKLKIFFNYDIATGEFKGFYNDEIHKNIPMNSIEISEELWLDMLLGQYKFNIEYINKINSPIQLKDKNIYFTKIEINNKDEKYYDLNELTIKTIAELKVDNQKKDYIISSLTQEVNKLNIRLNKLGG